MWRTTLQWRYHLLPLTKVEEYTLAHFVDMRIEHNKEDLLVIGYLIFNEMLKEDDIEGLKQENRLAHRNQNVTTN